MKKLEFLEDTIKYYSEDNNRRCTKGQRCYYSPIKAGKEGISEGCAIGRFLDKNTQHLFDSQAENSINYLLSENEEYILLLPEWMRTFDFQFLRAVQKLHDDMGCWVENGLSDYGLEGVQFIKDTYIK